MGTEHDLPPFIPLDQADIPQGEGSSGEAEMPSGKMKIPRKRRPRTTFPVDEAWRVTGDFPGGVPSLEDSPEDLDAVQGAASGAFRSHIRGLRLPDSDL